MRTICLAATISILGIGVSSCSKKDDTSTAGAQGTGGGASCAALSVTADGQKVDLPHAFAFKNGATGFEIYAFNHDQANCGNVRGRRSPPKDEILLDVFVSPDVPAMSGLRIGDVRKAGADVKVAAQDVPDKAGDAASICVSAPVEVESAGKKFSVSGLVKATLCAD